MGLSYETRHAALFGLHRHPGGGENLMGVPRLIFDSETNVSNINADITTVATIAIAPGRLSANGNFLEYIAEFDLMNVGNSKTLTYIFGGQNLNANPWNNTLASTQMVQIGRVYRTSAVTCRCYISNTLPFLGQANPFTQFRDIVVANMDVNTLNFEVTIQGAVSGDITHRVSHMYAVK